MNHPPQNILLVIFLTHIAVNLDALKFHVPMQHRRDNPVPRKYRHLDVHEEFLQQRNVLRRAPLLDLSTAALHSRPFHSRDRIFTNDRRKNDRRPEMRQGKVIVSDAHELREKVFDENIPLRDLQVNLDVANIAVSDLMTHEVIQLMVKRFHSQSKPGARAPDDKAILALAIEGGGVRGAVCSGMAAAIASLGLTDSFDTIVGSSAGSVIGAYMVRYVSYIALNTRAVVLITESY